MLRYIAIVVVFASVGMLITNCANSTSNTSTKLESTESKENLYLKNIYFTIDEGVSNIYVKALAENILANHGIDAEVSIS